MEVLETTSEKANTPQFYVGTDRAAGESCIVAYWASIKFDARMGQELMCDAQWQRLPCLACVCGG